MVFIRDLSVLETTDLLEIICKKFIMQKSVEEKVIATNLFVII